VVLPASFKDTWSLGPSVTTKWSIELYLLCLIVVAIMQALDSQLIT